MVIYYFFDSSTYSLTALEDYWDWLGPEAVADELVAEEVEAVGIGVASLDHWRNNPTGSVEQISCAAPAALEYADEFLCRVVAADFDYDAGMNTVAVAVADSAVGTNTVAVGVDLAVAGMHIAAEADHVVVGMNIAAVAAPDC